MNKKRFLSLNFKLMLVVMIALVATLAMFLLIDWVETMIVSRYYQSEEAIERNVGDAYTSLTRYVRLNKVKGTDTELLQGWVKENDYTSLEVYDNNSIYFNGGWLVSPTTIPDAEDESAESEFSEYAERITPSTFEEDVYHRIMDFEDDEYYVYLKVYTEQRFIRAMFFVKLIFCVTTLVGIILIYNSRVLRRMIRLSHEVQEVSGGNLDADIDPTANDEIGKLAVNVDTMRNSIVERLQSEKEAWDANTQLITAMSHDIRTPLTSLIGYLDIIESGKYSSEEDLARYIRSCRDKAFQLKDLSDKLFQYFLVFGSQEKKKELEVFDASILLQQLISEHAAELMSYGYNIDFDFNLADVEIKADLSGMRRLFDNLTSNILKYADKSYHIRISTEQVGEEIVVRLINGVLAVSRKVESNKIGLKTCEKICKDMGGTFDYRDEDNFFSVRITIPILKETAAEAPASAPAPAPAAENAEEKEPIETEKPA